MPRAMGVALAFRVGKQEMKRILLGAATALLGTMAYVMVGIALASAG